MYAGDTVGEMLDFLNINALPTGYATCMHWKCTQKNLHVEKSVAKSLRYVWFKSADVRGRYGWRNA